MFRGRSQRNIDGKGRLMLPPDFRRVCQEHDPDGRLILTNFDDCVAGYPMAEWQEIETRLDQIRNPNRQLRNFLRFFLGGAQEVTLDGQGRVNIPQSLRDYAGLDKEIVLVGVGAKFEVWDRGRHDTIMDQNFDDVSDALAATGVEVGL